MTLVQTTCPNCGHTQESTSKYPYKDMEVGETVFIKGMTCKDAAYQYPYQYGKKAGKKFKATTVEGGVIVERVE